MPRKILAEKEPASKRSKGRPEARGPSQGEGGGGGSLENTVLGRWKTARGCLTVVRGKGGISKGNKNHRETGEREVQKNQKGTNANRNMQRQARPTTKEDRPDTRDVGGLITGGASS